MAKECIVCGKKLGLLNGDVSGIMCDSCYGELGGYKVLSLECAVDANEFDRCYKDIENKIDGKLELSMSAKERLKTYFINQLDIITKRNIGIGMNEVYDYQVKCKEKETKRKETELKRVAYAQSFNEFYEYDVVTIINEDHGRIDKMKMMDILSEHARNGWRLHTMYSNELGKNAISLLGFGVNSTACEDVLIFERRIPEID